MSVSTIVKAYNGIVDISGMQIDSYQDLKNRLEDNSADMANVKNKIKQICACTPKDMFPSDSDGDTLWKMNRELDDLFDDLNDLEWDRAKLMMVSTIVDDWQYTGDKDPVKDWREICPDMYEDLRKDFAETFKQFTGNPDDIKKAAEETTKALQDAMDATKKDNS